ncbi:hypothetical protein [Erythrobacter sp. JK5]|uniref:hypothetical protein n=1 Tax=Erythrobacter sp. JK5 TaxID=2829500 RepID=UPI001BAA7008|nr:hypothetical protein [Erythrobacter sp. JK5]QUL38930.1 hypothetical protein KDC96_06145 [Erythrobacter sp. JK5]
MLGRFFFDNFQSILTTLVGVAWMFLFFSDEPMLPKVLGTVAMFVLAVLIGWYGAAFKAWYRDRRIRP